MTKHELIQPAFRPLAPIPWDGEKITRPGIYSGIPLESYHGPITDGPAVSSSLIRTAVNKSLFHFWDSFYLNPEHEPFEATANMILGSAAHHLILGEANFKGTFAFQPDEIAGKPWQGNRTECKAWKRQAKAEGLQIVTPDMLDKIRGMARALRHNPLVRQGALNGFIEHSMFWRDEKTGLWLKSRPDNIAAHGESIADYKTTEDAGRNKSEYAVTDYGLHMQVGLCGLGLEHFTGRRPDDPDYVLIFQETKRPFAVTARPVDPQAISLGRMQIRYGLDLIAPALAKYQERAADLRFRLTPDSDEWSDEMGDIIADCFPSYDHDMNSVGLTFSEAKRLEQMAEIGLLNKAFA